MGGGQEKAPCGVTADTGRDCRFATAAGNLKLAENRTARDRLGSLFIVAGKDVEPMRLRVTGREAWTLERLIAAPPKATDPRQFTGQTVQCEAIAPDALATIVRDAVEGRRDADAERKLLVLEADFRAGRVAELGRLA